MKNAKAKRRIDIRKVLLWIFFVSLFFILIWSLFSLIMNIVFGAYGNIMFGNLKYKVSTPDKTGKYVTVTRSVKASDYVKNKTVYINFTEIANDCDCYVSGDTEQIRYIFKGGDALFFFDSTLANIGGETVILDAPCIYEDGNLFVPATVAMYMHGLTAEYRNRVLFIEYDPKIVRPGNITGVEKPTPVTTE